MADDPKLVKRVVKKQTAEEKAIDDEALYWSKALWLMLVLVFMFIGIAYFS